MGEARRRGSYEERKAAAIERNERLAREIAERRRVAAEEAAIRRAESEDAKAEIRASLGRASASQRVALTAMAVGMALGAVGPLAVRADVPWKTDKGEQGGSCNRERCQAPGAWWHNHGNDKWYCRSCAIKINRSNPLCTDETPKEE